MVVPKENYTPARVAKSGKTTFILYYQTNPETGIRERFRQTFDLNRIRDPKLKQQRAEEMVLRINKMLPWGYPFSEELKQLNSEKDILSALAFAEVIKCKSRSQRTRDSYKSAVKILREFIVDQGWQNMRVNDFTRRHALAFMDYALLEREISNTTYNTYIARSRSIFTELVQREFLDRLEGGRVVPGKNPFSALPQRKESPKRRRAFNEAERRATAEYISKKDKIIYLGIVLQYYCFIRPSELRRLRPHMIHLDEGLIKIPGDKTKNAEAAQLTIPRSMLPVIKELAIGTIDPTYLIFGRKLEPHPEIPCGRNSMNFRHREYLEQLQKKRLIHDITGLTFYSWKDTGALELFKRKVNILEIMRQLRHKHLDTTQRYCQSLYIVNKEIRDLDNPLF